MTTEVTSKVHEEQELFNSSRIATDNIFNSFKEINQNASNVLIQAYDVEQKISNILKNSDSILNEIMAMTSVTEENSAAVEKVSASITEEDKKVEEIIHSFKELEILMAKLRNLMEKS